jgi:hypothetical protein
LADLGTLLLAALVASAQPSAPASSSTPVDDLPPAPSGAIVKAVQSCLDAVSLSGADAAKLKSEGWEQATDAQGKPANTGDVGMFERDGVLAFTTKPQGDGHGACTLMARIDDTATASEIAEALDQALGGQAQKPDNNDGEIYWVLPGQKFVDLSASGTKDRPSVRLTIAQGTEEKK